MTGACRPNAQLDTAKGRADVILTDGQNVTLHAAFPSPPGSPLSGVLNGTHATRVKVHGCRRIVTAEGEVAGASPPQAAVFEITGRWVNLSREARLELLGQTDPS